MVSSGEDQLLLFLTEKNAEFFLFFPQRNIFRIDFCQSVRVDRWQLHESTGFKAPGHVLITSTAVQNNRAEGSRGLIPIKPLCLDGIFPSSA